MPIVGARLELPVLPLEGYTVPEISMVGLTEEDCQKQDIPYRVGRTLSEDNARGQIIGESASELIHIDAQVMTMNSTLDVFINTVYNYPTLADTYKYAAYDAWANGNG